MSDDRFDKDQQSSMKVQSVQEFQHASSLQELYEQLYMQRYGTRPLYQPEEATIFGWLSKKVGPQRAKEVLKQYFRMDGDKYWWLKANHHSPSVLQKNAAIINSQVRDVGKPRSELKTQGKLACDSCWRAFDALYPANVSWRKTWIRCPKCLLDNAPWKYPTRAEYHSNWQRYTRDEQGEPISYERAFPHQNPYPEVDHLDYELVEPESVVA